MKHFGLICLFLILCVACTKSAEIVPDTPTPIVATPTPQPEPKSWDGPIVLVMWYDDADWLHPILERNRVPEIVLYADGRLIFKRDARGLERTIDEAWLSSAEICAFLYEVENTGVFAFSDSDYEKPPVEGGGTSYIRISAWHTRQFAAYELEISNAEALIKTSRLITRLPSNNGEPFQPTRVAVTFSYSRLRTVGEPWPLTSFALPDLATIPVEQVYEGEEAQTVYELFTQQYQKEYKIDGIDYLVTARPIYPHEVYQSNRSGRLPPIFDQNEKRTMTCDLAGESFLWEQGAGE